MRRASGEYKLRWGRPGQLDKPLDRDDEHQDQADLQRRGGGDDELAALELEIGEDLDRQRRLAGPGQEERGVKLAERDDEGEEPTRTKARAGSRGGERGEGSQRPVPKACPGFLLSKVRGHGPVAA